MPILDIQMTDKELAALKADAEKNGQPVCAFARSILVAHIENERKSWEKGWPSQFLDLYGSSPDFPNVPDLPPEPVRTW